MEARLLLTSSTMCGSAYFLYVAGLVAPVRSTHTHTLHSQSHAQVWRYTPGDGMWAWIGGSTQAGSGSSPGNFYGTAGVWVRVHVCVCLNLSRDRVLFAQAPTNIISARYNTNFVVDSTKVSGLLLAIARFADALSRSPCHLSLSMLAL